ncbi:MAG TPA: hypothetical protein VGN68_12145 [Sphingopyxis sp.]|jgi:hypothetical protein|nr:hypothetical protein [Sphingopyxis sp.]
MKAQRQDIVALGLFALIAVGGLWLWTGEGPAIWLADFAVMCGF